MLLHIGKSSTSQCFGVGCFQQPLDISGELNVSSHNFSLPGYIQVPARMCHRSIPTSSSSSTLLNGGSFASHSSQYVGRHSLLVPHCKGPHHGLLSQPCALGSAVAAYNPLVAQRCLLFSWGFSSSLCQTMAGATQASMTKLYQQCLKEWTISCVQEGVPNNAISVPNFADFLFHLFRIGLACHTIGIYHSAISAFWNFIVFIRLQIDHL